MTSNWLKDFNLKPRSNSVKTFKSYLNLESGDEEGVEISNTLSGTNKDYSEDDPYAKSFLCLEPSLLPGEVVVAQSDNVLKFNTLSEMNKGISGLLVCTNFKVGFLTAENFSSNLHQRNALLGENDICLINIDAVYHVNNGKRKKLSVSCSSMNIEIIEIHCKDFRIYTFSFKFSPQHQRSVINTIIHHAFAPRINLLFAFDYKQPPPHCEEKESHSILFTRPCDWESELERCKCPGWRVTLANEKFLLCDSLPECFVVPSILLDMNLNKSAPHFAGHRVPTWSWGMASGASIIRMASLDPSISDSRQREVMVDAISRASPRQLTVRIFDLDERCPGPREVQSSFLKLRELCMPSTSQEFWDTDNNYLKLLDSTKWLHHISTCLSIALDSANLLMSGTTIIFSEHVGRDLSAILSSLVQILLDPICRTTSGFELLVQKEWIALGHPFAERHRLVSGSEGEEAPVFLLFLDCVWQLSEQCPSLFEFSETYLTSLWDSCRVSLFDTFLFSCPKSRAEAIAGGFALRSVWRWSWQFSRNDVRFFSNPLYVLNRYGTTPPTRPLSAGCARRPLVLRREGVDLLNIDPHIKSLRIWHQCYLRWIPPAQVLGGGAPVLFVTNLQVCSEIEALEREIGRQSAPSSRHRRAASDDYTISAESIGPRGAASSVLTSVFPFAPVAPWDWSSYRYVPATSCLKISYAEDANLDD